MGTELYKTSIDSESHLRFLQASSNQHHAQIQPYLLQLLSDRLWPLPTVTWKSQDGQQYTLKGLQLDAVICTASSSKMTLTREEPYVTLLLTRDTLQDHAPDLFITM